MWGTKKESGAPCFGAPRPDSSVSCEGYLPFFFGTFLGAFFIAHTPYQGLPSEFGAPAFRWFNVALN